MKAAVLHELNKPMTIEEFEIPGIGPDEVLIKVKACGVWVVGYFRLGRSL